MDSADGALRVLFLEDSVHDYEMALGELRRAHLDIEPSWADSKASFLELLQSSRPQAILSDYSIPGYDGISALEAAQQFLRNTPFILVSGQIGEERAAKAFRYGVTDFVSKDNLSRLPRVLLRALREKEEVARRKRAQRELEESNRRYARLIKNVPGSVFRCRAEGSFELDFISIGVHALTGYKPDELIGQEGAWDALIHPKHQERFRKEMAQSLQEDAGYELSYPIITKGGDTKWVLDKGNLVYGLKKNHAVAIEGILLDITLQRTAREQIMASIIDGEDRERQRLADEIHDSLGQQLTVTKMAMQAAMSAIEHEPLKEKLANVDEMLAKAMEEARVISQNLMPKTIYDYGLQGALEAMVSDYKRLKGININFYSNIKDVRFDSKVELGLYRIAQEASSNAIKHANATVVHIQVILGQDNWLSLSIEDDGTGIDSNKQQSSLSGRGLSNMNNRARALGAELQIETSPKAGTTVMVELAGIKTTENED